MPNWTDDNGVSHFNCRRPHCCGNDGEGRPPQPRAEPETTVLGGFVERIRRAFLFPLGPDMQSLLELASDPGVALGLLSDVDPAMVLGDGDDGEDEYPDQTERAGPPVAAPLPRRPKRPPAHAAPAPAPEPQTQKEKTTMGALEIQNTSEITMPWTAWFLYGSMGAGKTRAAATFPDPLFILPANENSHLTLAQLKEQNIPYITIGKRPDGTPVKARQHLSEVLTELDRRHGLMRQCYAKAMKEPNPDARAALEAEALKHFPWQTIVGDALTHLGDLLVDDVSNQGAKKMDQQGWGIVSNEYRTLHSRLRNMDVHVVYTALAKTQEAEGGGIAQGGPNLIGSMAEKLPSACDVVVYMEELAGDAKTGPTYRAYLRKYRWWQARTRFGGFPDYMDSFDFRKLEPKIVGSAAAVSAQAAPPA